MSLRPVADRPEMPEYNVYAVRPQLAFGFLDDPEDFTGAATRWRFARRVAMDWAAFRTFSNAESA